MNRVAPSAEEVIHAAGGTITRNSLPRALRDDLYPVLEMVLAWNRASLGDFGRATGTTARMEIVNSPFYTCRARQVADGSYVLLIPLGLIIRTYVLANVLLSYWNAPKILTVFGQTDTIRWAPPDQLEPLFGKASSFQPWWTGLEALYKKNAEPAWRPDAEQLTSLAITFIAGHESAHIYRQHGPILNALRQTGWVRDSAEEAVYRRFAEIDADIVATHYSLDLQHIALQTGGDRPLAYLRLSYAVTLLHALYDAHRKSIGTYETGAYPHPVIRRHFFNTVAGIQIGAWSGKVNGFLKNELEGWTRCVDALHALDFDVERGRYGKCPSGYVATPISAVRYDKPADELQATYDRELVLYLMMDHVWRLGARVPPEQRVTHIHKEGVLRLPGKKRLLRVIASGDDLFQTGRAVWKRTLQQDLSITANEYPENRQQTGPVRNGFAALFPAPLWRRAEKVSPDTIKWRAIYEADRSAPE